MRIERAQDHRAAIREAQELDGAREGNPEYRRRQQLRAAMHVYELQLRQPECRMGRPTRRS